MKNLLFFVFIFNSGGLIALAQAPPPPAPLIYKAPQKTDLNEFVSEDNTFQITFPGVPKITKQEIPNGTVTNYRVYRQGSSSVVNAIDYNFELENQKEKIYEIVKNNLLKAPKAAIGAERDIIISGTAGKEFDVLQDYQFQTIRVLIIGRRIYEIKSDVTNWHILSKYNKDKAVDFENETRRFLDSFKSIKSPEIVVTPVPTDFLGTSTDTSYKNTFFNFSLELPKTWSRLNRAEIDASKNVGLEILKTEKEKINRAFEDAAKQEVVIFLAVYKNEGSEKGASFGVGVLKQLNSQVNSEMVAVATKNFFLTNPNFKLLKDVQKIKRNGTEFSTFTFQNNADGTALTQSFFTTIRKGHSLTFVLTHRNTESRNSLEKIMQSLNFDTK